MRTTGNLKKRYANINDATGLLNACYSSVYLRECSNTITIYCIVILSFNSKTINKNILIKNIYDLRHSLTPWGVGASRGVWQGVVGRGDVVGRWVMAWGVGQLWACGGAWWCI